ncbi:hypothetical protein GCM10027570_18200 [Streptomonospora sediminis]
MECAEFGVQAFAQLVAVHGRLGEVPEDGEFKHPRPHRTHARTFPSVAPMGVSRAGAGSVPACTSRSGGRRVRGTAAAAPECAPIWDDGASVRGLSTYKYIAPI